MNSVVLEYLKVLLTGPVLFSLTALVFIIIFKEDIKSLILRIAKIKFPGGELHSVPQSKKMAVEEKSAPEPAVDNEQQIIGLPVDLTSKQRSEVEEIIRSHIATAYVWEYRYLNFFLARSSQLVLDWMVTLSQPITYSFYESIWIPNIPSSVERSAVIDALQAHHLIQFNESRLFEITPKGREYHGWRGPIPSESE